jgi:hypothetical protein
MAVASARLAGERADLWRARGTFAASGAAAARRRCLRSVWRKSAKAILDGSMDGSDRLVRRHIYVLP